MEAVPEASAPGHNNAVVLRGGAVRRNGYAILVVGSDRRAGTSRLIAALLRAGAEPLGDGEISIDHRGRVRVPTADAGADGVDVALIVATTYQVGALWRPQELHGTRAVLPILERAASKSGSLRRLLSLAANLAPRATTLLGARPEADAVAAEILAYFDGAIEGGSPGPSTTRETQIVGRALNLVATAAADEFAELPVDTERQLLLRRPSLVLLHWHGRFGNRMHQYAYGVTYARLNQRQLWLPSHWEGTHLFATQHHAVLPRGRLRTTLNRSRDQFDHPERRFAGLRAVVPEAVMLTPTDPRRNYAPQPTPVACFDNMCAYHPSIFTAMSRAHLLSVFSFSAAVKQLDLYKRLEDRQGTYDIAHLRRDDISNPKYNQTHVQGYSVISKRSYEAAFAKFGFDPATIEWVSDDYTGKWHTDRSPTKRGGWRYPAGSEVLPDVMFDWLEDFLRLYFARTIFRANSSFSWWAAFLSPSARVFSPVVDKRHIYGIDGLEEIDVDFVEGNHPHWMYGNADIRIGA